MKNKSASTKVGDVYSSWTVISEAEPRRYGLVKTKFKMFVCRCQCGVVRVVTDNSLRSGSSRSCGCVPNKPIKRRRFAVENIDRVDLKSLILRYSSMLDRCSNPKNAGYYRYGGRGIKVCKMWRDSFAVFAKWAMQEGFSPKLQIDRINNDGNYTPSNCRWVSSAKNIRNRSVVKLNAADAIAIRRLIEREMPMHSIADLFGVDLSLVSKIYSGKLWAVIDIEEIKGYIGNGTKFLNT